jgi:hypothetical protein
MTVSLVGRATPMQARDKRVFRSAISRTVIAATAIKEGCKVAFALAGLLTFMIVLAALDVWIWVPHFRN